MAIILSLDATDLPAEGDVLIYNAVSKKWLPAPPPAQATHTHSGFVLTDDPRLSDARTPTTHTHTIAALPAGSVLATGANTRPTSRTDIVVIWTGVTDPGGAAFSGDIWLGTP